MVEGGSRRLSEGDTTFLTLEASGAGSYVPVGVVIHDRPFDDPAMMDHLTEVMVRLLPAARQRIVKDRFSTALPRWADVPDFDPADHTVRLPPPGDGTLRPILDWAAEWGRTPFVAGRPPWRTVFFEGVTVDGVPGRMVGVTQIHHSIVDGQGGMRMAEQYYQWGPEGGLPPLPPPLEPDTRSDFEHWKEGWAEEGAKAKAVLRNTGRRLRWIASDPAAGLARVQDLRRAFGRMRVQQGTETLSPILRRKSDRDRFDILPVDVGALRAGAKVLGGSFNDGLLAAVSVGLHRWHVDHGVRVPALRTAMPINTRPSDAGWEGNQITGVIMEMALLDDAAMAVKRCIELTRAHIADTDVLWLNERLRGVANRLPPAVTGRMMAKAMHALDLSVSNVRGAPMRQWVAGVEVLATLPFLAGSSALAISLVSGGGHATLGVVTCPEAIRDPENLMARLAEGIAEVSALVPPA